MCDMPREPANAFERAAMRRYWKARLDFERVTRETPPDLHGLARDEVEGMLSDIDLPCLEWPRVEERMIADG